MKVTPISRWGFWLAFWAGATWFAWAGNAPCRGYAAETGTRSEISLDGDWEIAEGEMDRVPEKFDHRVQVPGLVDLAVPQFESPGATVPPDERRQRKRPADPRREAFWYRRFFVLDGPVPEAAWLKINKARYGTKVILNGQVVGDHGPNWTPGWFEVQGSLRGDGRQNELLIRVGASPAQVPPYLTEGWDFEKSRYIPGIYDSVALILSGRPHIVNVQIVPDVERKSVRAVIELADPASGPVKARVCEVRSGRLVGDVSVETPLARRVEVTVPIREARLWSPEDPFLYELVVDTGGDVSRTRFGLRSFTTDPASGRALLNGRPYFLRGSNICIYRFFEDSQRGRLPWDREWVRTLLRRFKGMHWNALRYCIGFPPEAWYEIADEEGFLIQDEFPIWYGGGLDAWPKEITQEHLAAEFTEWMRERWNHPCVVIWDAQNETTDDAVVAAAIRAVRGLDLSSRPWDNGWGAPQQPGDISEAHPYRANRPNFSLGIFAEETGIPNNGPGTGRRPFVNLGRPPYLINEYGWLWINRDDTLPTLTVDVYQRLLGEKATVEQCRRYYARILAAKTEFWRSRRKCAGVLHFCGLGYSRPDGQTSDHFIDLERLILDPYFQRFVGDAFAPVLAVVDFWEETAAPADQLRIVVINDREHSVAADVRLEWRRNGSVIHEERRNLSVPAWGTETMDCAVPDCGSPGTYEISAVVFAEGEPPARSYRLFTVSDVGQ